MRRLLVIVGVVLVIFAGSLRTAEAHYGVNRWTCLAHYESTHRWHYNGTYDGGLQFHPDTWTAFGGGRYAPYAYQATKREQWQIGRNTAFRGNWKYQRTGGRYGHGPQGWTAWQRNWWKCN